MKKAVTSARGTDIAEGRTNHGDEGRELVGIVAGGFEEPIETEIFKVIVPAASKRRIIGDLKVDTIVRVEAIDKSRMPVLGRIRRMVIQPDSSYISAKDMAAVSGRGKRRKRGTTWRQDSEILEVESLGQLVDGRVVGPLRPPERESPVYLANAEDIKTALIVEQPRESTLTIPVGLYANPESIYRPYVVIDLPMDVIWYHGIIVGATGGGKSNTIAVLDKILSERGLAVVQFNVKGSEFLYLDQPCPNEVMETNFKRAPNGKAAWSALGIQPAGVRDFKLFVLKGRDCKRKDGLAKNFDLELEALGDSYLELILKDRVSGMGIDSLIHAKDNIKYNLDREGRSYDLREITRFLSILVRAAEQSRDQEIKIPGPTSSAGIHIQTAKSILRGLEQLLLMDLFDDPNVPTIPIEELVKPGRVSVIDVAPLSRDAQEVTVSYVLWALYDHIHRLHSLGEKYPPAVVIVDEAWKILKDEATLQGVERIARQGRSLRFGLFFASQNLPGQEAKHVLGQCHSMIIHRMGEDFDKLKELVPHFDEKDVARLSNLPTGLAYVWNKQYYRFAISAQVPLAPCRHATE
nr:ATP-binding protein [Candidatus Njordarchaeota archaeon]